MHAFALVMGSILAHEWARTVITAAQRIVTYFRASHKPLGTLLQEARRQGIKTTLKTSNQTRLTSTHLCLQSVLKLQPAFATYLTKAEQDPDLLPASQAAVRETLEDFQFWAKVKVMDTLLAPFSRVVMAVQRDSATLADITRYWLYLNVQVRAVLPSILDPAYRKHVITAFNRRAVEMDSQLSRLALFLDPRYMQVAGTDDAFQKIMLEVSCVGLLLARCNGVRSNLSWFVHRAFTGKQDLPHARED